jgi:predicted nucleic acid-binding protein
MIVSEGTLAPGPAYIDSSALVRVYIPCQASGNLNAAVEGRTDLMVSDFALTEVTSAVCRLRTEGSLDAETAFKIHSQLLRHAESGVFESVDLTGPIHRSAEKRLLNTRAFPLRAGDALHLELALAGKCLTMVTFDYRLAKASRSIGLLVFAG